MILSMAEDNQIGNMIISESTMNTAIETKTSPIKLAIEEQPGEHDTTTSNQHTASEKAIPPVKKEAQDAVQKVKVMHEILDRKLKKAEEQKTFLFQERANKRRSFNSLRRSLSSNNKSELGDETTLEQMRQQLEALREEKEHVEDEIEKTQQRLCELNLIKESPQEKAARLDELCTLVTKEFASRRKPTYEA